MKRVEFPAPRGFATPEGKSSGDRFESMATFQIKKNGDLCLVAVGDYKMPGYEDKKEHNYRDEGAEVATAYRAQMS